ncbi:MAG TPA: ABC transporter permease [Alphaproteobacteria bacterium]|nr:ABC transporter permease [Paracoccaceae bacterium]HBQ22629.1 ABC transporter permease [Alphaproteobacteria bacterium]
MRNLYTFLKYGFISIWSMFVVAPFLWALSTSFKDFQSVTSGATYIPWLQFEPTLEGWRVLWRTPASGGVDIVEPYFNSILVTCSASLISILLGTLAAYALSRFTFKAGFIKNNDITFFFISQRIMPPVVLSIPFFIMLGYLGLLDSLFGLIMVYIVLLMPIAVWIMVDFFNKVPREIDETALIDGCNPYQAFFKVVLPNSIPGMIVAGMFCLIFGWTDFFFAFILTFTEVQLLPVRIVALNSSITPWWSLSASALISVAPLIMVAFIVERFLSKGNLSGALK